MASCNGRSGLSSRLVALSLAHTQQLPPETQRITMSALGISFAKQLRASRTFGPMAKRLGEKYAELAGWRAHGLKYDDILLEESATVQKVLSASKPVLWSSRTVSEGVSPGR